MTEAIWGGGSEARSGVGANGRDEAHPYGAMPVDFT